MCVLCFVPVPLTSSAFKKSLKLIYAQSKLVAYQFCGKTSLCSCFEMTRSPSSKLMVTLLSFMGVEFLFFISTMTGCRCKAACIIYQ